MKTNYLPLLAIIFIFLCVIVLTIELIKSITAQRNYEQRLERYERNKERLAESAYKRKIKNLDTRSVASEILKCYIKSLDPTYKVAKVFQSLRNKGTELEYLKIMNWIIEDAIKRYE